MSVALTIMGLDDLIDRLTLVQAAMADPSLVATVGSAVDYSGFVESGTARMAARPYLAPAEEQEMPELVDAIGAGAVEVFEIGDAGALARRFRTGVGLVETAAESIVHVVTGNLRGSIHTEFGQ